MISVILSGGSGSRLWPVSRQAFPKQFCDLLDESLFVKTVKRLEPYGAPWVVTVKDLRILTERSLRDLGIAEETNSQVIYEPFGRNTAPAIALLTMTLEQRGFGDKVVGVFPADHLIGDETAFHAAVRLGEKAALTGEIVTLGIEPTYPATGYGYIETAGEIEELRLDSGVAARRAVRFREKPNEETAREFLDEGGYYWNAGMFIFKVSRMAELLRQYAPDIWSAVSRIDAQGSNAAEVYSKVRATSIDYALMERIPSHVCIPCQFEWSDLGSWDSVAGELENHQLRTQPMTISVKAKGNFVMASSDKMYAFVDVDDLVVVDTADAVLVARRGSTERVKDVVDRLNAGSGTKAKQHIFEIRPWGRFEVLRDAEKFKSKVISVDAGAQISYQSHNKRTEHWVIVAGQGEVILDGIATQVKPGSHVHIPVGSKHRIRNTGRETIQFVEVQLGSYFGEDDIVRYEDSYGRT